MCGHVWVFVYVCFYMLYEGFYWSSQQSHKQGGKAKEHGGRLRSRVAV